MSKDAMFVGSPPEEPPVPPAEPARRGFVKGAVTYTVTDDLVISPMSNVSSIALLNACAVRDLGALQERTVHIGYKEVTAVCSSVPCICTDRSVSLTVGC